jgi:hypothetical protein
MIFRFQKLTPLFRSTNRSDQFALFGQTDRNAFSTISQFTSNADLSKQCHPSMPRGLRLNVEYRKFFSSPTKASAFTATWSKPFRAGRTLNSHPGFGILDTSPILLNCTRAAASCHLPRHRSDAEWSNRSLSQLIQYFWLQEAIPQEFAKIA